jgi:hypothetical protein
MQIMQGQHQGDKTWIPEILGTEEKEHGVEGLFEDSVT